jgi:ribosomal protein L10
VSKSKPDIVESVLSRVKESSPGFIAWYRRLPPEDLSRLESLRDRWASGEVQIQKRALARAIIEECRDRGLYVTGVQGVEDWLNHATGKKR